MFVLAASLLSGLALAGTVGAPAAPQLNVAVGRHGGVHILPTRAGVAALRAANGNAGAINTSFPHNLLPYNGGPVMHSSHVYTIYWLPSGYNYGDPVSTANYESLINGFFTNLSGTSFYDILTQYPDTTGPLTHTNSLGGTYVDTTAYPCGSTCGDVNTSGHFLTDSDIQNEVLRATHANSWQPGLTNQYMVFYGNGVQSCFDSSGPPSGCSHTDYCAYHGQFTGNNGSVNGQWIYSNMYDAGTDGNCALGAGGSPNSDAVADQEISPTSHEMSESITDPDPLAQAQGQAWQNANPGPSGFGGEIGDLCAYVWEGNPSLNGHSYAIQSEWSNYDANCVISDSIPTSVTYTGPTSAAAGTTVTLTATLKDGNNAAVGSQSVKITLGSQSCSGQTDFSSSGATLGHASCQITLNQVAGPYNIQAQYLGGIGAYQASNSTTGTFTIGIQGTTETLACTPNPQQAQHSVTCTATVSPATSGTPTGTVTFKDNGSTICSAVPLNQLNPDKAVCTFTAVTLGTNTIVANYSGDGSYASNSATFVEMIQGGTITVIEHLASNANDPATFNLLIDGTTYASNVGINGGTTGAVPVAVGSHTVSETPGLFTNMGNYTARIACSDGLAVYGTSLSGIAISNGGSVTCTITNTRKLFKP